MTEQPYPEESRHDARVLLGSAIILIGVAMLVERNDGWAIRLDASWWPLLLLLLGFVKLVAPGERRGRPRSRRSAIWLLSIGTWGLISEAELFGLDYSTSWPLLVVALGLNIAWGALEAPPVRRIQER